MKPSMVKAFFSVLYECSSAPRGRGQRPTVGGTAALPVFQLHLLRTESWDSKLSTRCVWRHEFRVHLTPGSAADPAALRLILFAPPLFSLSDY